MNRRTTAEIVFVGLSVAMAVAIPWCPASAQNAGSSSPGAAKSNDALEEVVVTAERRSADLQATPISIAAISGEQLAEQHTQVISDLQNTTPNFQVNTTGMYNSINIRGIGNSAITPAITTGVAVFRDGLFSPETHGLSDPFFDIADVEILRGPQGTFVGFASTGGAVQINSQNPNLNGINGYVETVLGDYSDKKVDGAVNLPISDTWAARIAFNAEQMNSFYKNTGSILTPGQPSRPITDPGQVRDRNMRLSLLWKPSDTFQALAKFEYNSSDIGGTANQPNQNSFSPPAGNPCPDGNPGPCHSTYYPYSTHQPFVLNYDRTDLFDPYTDIRTGLELSFTLPGDIVLRSLTGFQQSRFNVGEDQDASSANAQAFYEYIPPDDYYSEEINLISPTTGRLSWVLGASYFYRNTGVTLFGENFFLGMPAADGNPARPQRVLADGTTINRIAGVFGQISYKLIDSLELQVGVRENWDNNAQSAFGNRIEVQIPVPLPPPGTPAPPPGTVLPPPPPPFSPCAYQVPPGYLCIAVPNTGKFKDNVPTGKVGLNWTPAEGQFFYAFYARGYKAGGIQPGGLPPFDPERVNDYELGWKARMFDGRLLASLGGFWMSYKNMQQTVYNGATGSPGNIVNLGSATIRGFEATAQSRLGGLGIDLSVAYTQSKLGSITAIADYRLPPTASNQPQCVGGAVTGCFNYAPYVYSLSGEKNPFSPQLMVNLSFDYSIPLAGHTLRPRISYSYTDDQYASLFQTDDFFHMKSRSLLNASLSYEASPWVTQLYVTNIADKTYVSGYSGGIASTEFYGAPRQFGIRIRRDF